MWPYERGTGVAVRERCWCGRTREVLVWSYVRGTGVAVRDAQTGGECLSWSGQW